MKSNLTQQMDLARDIKAAENLPVACVVIRRWLEVNGYENIQLCQHYTVIRANGKCASCGRQVVRNGN